jgi:hypothetical protein
LSLARQKLQPGKPDNYPDLISLSFSAKAGWCGALLYPRASARVKAKRKYLITTRNLRSTTGLQIKQLKQKEIEL